MYTIYKGVFVMSVVFQQGQVLGRGDLDIFLTNSSSNPTNVYYIRDRKSVV